jgi:hypothetical protein
MKLLQIIVILCGLAGSVMGLDLLRLQPGRTAGGDTSGSIEVTRPCLDENGEPTC